MACMTMTKMAMPMATRRRRWRRPAVIIDSQSRHASRDSCCANHTAVPDWIIVPRASRGRRRGDQRQEGVFQAGAAADAARVMTVVGGLAAQLLERAFGDEPAVGDDADAVGHAFGDFENMRGHDDGAAGAGALAQHAFDLPRRAGVEAGERLVENDDAWLVYQGAGERHFLAHTLGETLAAFVGVRRKPEPGQ